MAFRDFTFPEVQQLLDLTVDFERGAGEAARWVCGHDSRWRGVGVGDRLRESKVGVHHRSRPPSRDDTWIIRICLRCMLKYAETLGFRGHDKLRGLAADSIGTVRIVDGPTCEFRTKLFASKLGMQYRFG